MQLSEVNEEKLPYVVIASECLWRSKQMAPIPERLFFGLVYPPCHPERHDVLRQPS